ncbi:hypothetical protein TrispH2_010489 [Trichoplax sp. H2]|nr:hypothetical protein TrispH2_010489 [Trichoplax sp. H2]|eukprot:RDD37405.1 hypothetical protein TrispH2_010489 [Trichoplax sp. H2]
MTCPEVLRYIKKRCRLFQYDYKTNDRSHYATLPSAERLHKGIVMAMCDEGLRSLKKDYELDFEAVKPKVDNVVRVMVPFEDELEKVKNRVLRKMLKYIDSFKIAGYAEVVEYYKDKAFKYLQVLHAESEAVLIQAENEEVQSEKKRANEEIKN